ncbi:hypothetical protein D9M71_829040 [compost metagenome]
MGVENQQRWLPGAGLVFPLQLPAGDLRNVCQAGITRVLFDKPADIFVDQHSAEMRLQLGREPALATGFRAGEYQDFHVRNAGSVRHSRQP